MRLTCPSCFFQATRSATRGGLASARTGGSQLPLLSKSFQALCHLVEIFASLYSGKVEWRCPISVERREDPCGVISQH